MGTAQRLRATLALAVLVLALHGGSGFKEGEFKKCKDAGFCRRHRAIPGARFDVKGDSVRVQGGQLSATLRNAQANVDLQLELKGYSDGFVRLTIDEAPEVGRYRVRDIVSPHIEERLLTWRTLKNDPKEIVLAGPNSLQVTLSYEPFHLMVVVAGKPAITLNSRGLFDFEHRRAQQEGVECDGCWSETFLQFTDTKPRGPQAMSLDISFPGFEHVYGLPERATSFALKPTPAESEPYRLYNLDVFEYLHESPFGLYGSIPMMVAHKAGLTTGVLWLNAAEMFVDVTKAPDGTATQWIAESGIVDLFVFLGPNPADVSRQYAVLTGTTALPQLFSLGYHQCRWNYKDEADVHAVDSGFDIHEIPYDVIWLDIEHTNGKRYLTWDSSVFPHPAELQNDVASRGRKTVTIVDPHVKRDPSYNIYQHAQQKQYFVRTKDGGEFDGWCWPGSSAYLDVSNLEVREWWSHRFSLFNYEGSTEHLYIWNDMNEPSVFNGPEVTMQKDLLHWGDAEHRDVHNLYGLYYHMATAQGLAVRGEQIHGEDGDRPFVLSRAFFAGTQTVGPIWTGDNTADWNHLSVSIPMLLSLGVTGLTFSGADVGGFFGNPDPELLTRWYQVGTFYPFFRGHAHLETQRREPWLFGEETTGRIRTAIRERYALLPYIYTLFRAANTTGAPVLRPLWYEFPHNKDLFAVDKEFMLGPSMLVRPILEPASGSSSTVDTALPQGARWFCAHTGAEIPRAQGLHQKLAVTLDAIPVFYRGGGIVPRRERPRRSTVTMARDPFTLIVALDQDGNAHGDLYVDDGRSLAFKKGHYLHRDFNFTRLTLSSSAHATEPGATASDASWAQALAEMLSIERIVFLGLPPSAKGYSARLPGMSAPVALEAGPVSPRVPSASAQVLRAYNLPVVDNWSVVLVANA